MKYAQSLRVIGQTLEVAKVFSFTLEGDGRNYQLQSDSMSRTAEWMLRYVAGENDAPTTADRRAPAGRSKSAELKPVRFSAAVIASLNEREVKRRGSLPHSEQGISGKLSHLLRTLGDHLDRNSAQTFHIFWMADAIVLDYQRPDGLTDRQRFTTEKLIEFGNSRLARPSFEHKNK
jgi:hypothetical protein